MRNDFIGRRKVSRSRDVLNNTWVVSGTRIPVASVKRLHEDGYTVEQIIAEYPDLSKEDVDAVLAFSAARDLKIRRSLARVVRKVKFRLLIQRELLRVQVFLMNVRCLVLRLADGCAEGDRA